MPYRTYTDADISPRVTPLPDGGWLAVVPAGRPQLGVVANTEEEVRVAYSNALKRRAALLAAARESPAAEG